VNDCRHRAAQLLAWLRAAIDRLPRSEKERAYWVKNLDLLLAVTDREDFPARARIQENLASGAVPEIVYGRMEPALVRLHRSTDAALARTTGGGGREGDVLERPDAAGTAIGADRSERNASGEAR
jgi:hypothetical protein